MQHKHTRRGFTLIELLVVVLIIGILAAVAVPQYQLAVNKARFSHLIGMASEVVKAQETYYLANGKYTKKWEELDLSFNGSSSSDTLTLNDEYELKLWVKQTYNPSAVTITDTKLPGITLWAGYTYNSTTWAGQTACYALSTNAAANKLCQNVTNKKKYDMGSGSDTYVYFF